MNAASKSSAGDSDIASSDNKPVADKLKERELAESPGVGVPRTGGRSIRAKPVRLADMSRHERESMFDGPAEWVDTPSHASQLEMPGASKVVKEETLTFDLSDQAERDAYNKLTCELLSPVTNMRIVHRELRAFDASGSWKVLVVLQYLKFRKIISKREQPDPSKDY